MTLLKFLTLFALVLPVHAQQTKLNGYPSSPDERLLTENYWVSTYSTQPNPNPSPIGQRAPNKDEEAVVEKAKAVFLNTTLKVAALIDGNDVIWSAHKGPATPATRLSGYSMGKTVTSMAIGKAICDNKIAADTQAGSLLPELKGTGYENVNVLNLLTMSSGIKDGSYWASGTKEAKEKLMQIAEKKASWRDLLMIVNQRKTTLFSGELKAGEKFEYKESDPLVLGLMLQAATGQSFANHIEKSVLASAGVAGPAALQQDASGNTYAPTVARMTLDDWIRFAIWVKNSEGEAGCFGDYVRQATTPKIPISGDAGFRWHKSYGYSVWTENFQTPDSYWAWGFGGQRIGWNHKNKRILVVFSNLENNTEEVYQLYKLWSALP